MGVLSKIRKTKKQIFIISFALSMIFYFPYITESIQGFSCGILVIISTLLGYKKWGLIASMWSIFVLGLSYFFWTSMSLTAYLSMSIFFIILSLWGGSLLESKTKKLEETKQLYNNVINTQEEMICRFKVDTTLTFVNQAYCDYFNKSESDLIGEKFLKFIPEEEHQFILDHLENLAEGQTPISYEHQANSEAGEVVWQRWTDYPIFNEQGELISFQSIGVDITERKQREQELRKAKQKAEAANRSKSNFIANMSHEIRTPLNSIIGFSELLLEEEKNSDKKSKLRTIVNSGQHLKAIISDILDFSRIEANKVELEEIEFSIRQLLTEIKIMFSMQDQNLDFHLAIDDNVPQLLKGDKYRINQIIINLVSNAFKFTSEGSIEIACHYQDQDIIIEVSDTGIGIPKEKHDKLFSAFEQVDSSITIKYEGAGLGLAIVKRLVNLMGGSITFESEVGIGTTFRVRVPLEIVKEQEKNSDSVASETSNQQGKQMVKKWINADLEIKDLTLQAIQELLTRIAKLEKSVAEQNKAEIERVAHKLKGLAANFNLREIYDLTAEITSLARTDNFNSDKIEQLVVNLKNIIDTIPDSYLLKEEQKNFAILLAEDERLNQLLIKEILRDLAVKIDVVDNGKQVLNKVGTKNYDLLLLDIQMPIMSGLEVMKELDIDITVIAITASMEKEVIEQCLSLGCKEYLTKPLDKDKLRKLVKQELGVGS